MTTASVSLNAIEDFLTRKRIAFVGISREKQHISVALFHEFTSHGYEVLFVNPNAPEIMGRPCFARVQEIRPAPDAALLFTPAVVTLRVVRECANAGVKSIWMYRGGGQGAVSEEAIEFCVSHGIQVIPGACPFMFLTPVRHIHWVHRCLSKLFGHYPKHTPSCTSSPV